MKARDIAGSVGRRASSAREQCEAALARIAARNPALNAVITLRPDVSLAEAAAVDARVAAGERMPLAGVPYTLREPLPSAGAVSASVTRAVAWPSRPGTRA